MRRLALAALAVALPLALAAPASATFHLMKVNELSLSMNGDSGAQFVELKDDSDEPFPLTNEPYKLVVFDSGGTRLTAQDLGNPFDDIGRDTSQPFLIASDAAGLGARDLELTVPLPAGAGSVCFTSGAGESRVHCVAYGCPAVRPSSSGVTQAGLAPPDGQSLQRLDSSLSIGPPTPKGSNSAGAAAGCSGGPGGGDGGGGGGGGTGGGADTTKPAVTSSARRRQDVDALAVTVRLSEDARLTVGGTVNLPGGARTLRFRTVRRNVAAGARTRVRLKLRRSRLRAVKRSLRNGRRLTAKVKITAKDAAGNTSTARRSVRLKN